MNSPNEEEKLPLRDRIKNFSELYLSHHEINEKCKHHVFKIGPLYLCVGCTSVLLGFITFLISFFVWLEFFLPNPLALALTASFGVLMSLIQLWFKPKLKWVKSLMRLSLGVGLSAFVGLIVLIPNIFLKLGLFLLLVIGTILYNIVRRSLNEDNCS